MPMTRRDGGLALLAAKLIAVGGTAIAGFLSWVHLSAMVAKARTVVPLCGGAAWLDCDSVLNSAWSNWLGFPVAPVGLLIWLVVLACLMWPGLRDSLVRQTVLLASILLLLIAAVFYVYIQLVELRAICTWCMADHTMAILLAMVALLGLRVELGKARLVPGVGAAIAGGVLLVLGVGGGSSLGSFTVAISTENGRWIETDDAAHAITFNDGNVVLDRRSHPIIGGPDANKFIIELIDPKCGRCALFAPKLKQAMAMLGPEYALVIGYVPSEVGCNHYLQASPEYGKDSCELTKLALAVWLARPEAFEPFSDWLMAELDSLTVDRARSRAAGLVGDDALAEALADPRITQMIRRDVDLAVHMDIEILPGIVVGNTTFRALPTEPADFVTLTRQLLAEPNYRPPASE
jgi:uncharacterized membrane protein/protein-disulfide isomerase